MTGVAVASASTPVSHPAESVHNPRSPRLSPSAEHASSSVVHCRFQIPTESRLGHLEGKIVDLGRGLALISECYP